MGKRLKKTRSICSCVSPHLTPQVIFNWYEEDVWTEIAKCLDGKSLIMLATTCKWFNHVIMEDNVWKYACQRDLQVFDTAKVAFKWIDLYAAAFDGSHTYMFQQQEKHIDWMRIGAFSIDSHAALLSESLVAPLRIPKEATEQPLVSNGCCLVKNIKNGIWIADLQLVRCPVCDLHSCDGTMQTLDARHIELFLHKDFHDGTWEYEALGSHDIKKPVDRASGGIFGVHHLNEDSTSAIFDLKSWVGKSNDWQPKAMITPYAVAINTFLQDNEGIQIKFHIMKAGKDGEVVAIRISHQLL